MNYNHKKGNPNMKNDKATNSFQTAIKNYLDSFAKEDQHFAERYNLEKKTLKECETYILGEVNDLAKGARTHVMNDDEVYQMARHYYLEDNIKIKKVNGTATTAPSETSKTKTKVKLTPEEMEQAKAAAEEEYKQKYIEDLKAKEQKKKQTQIIKQKKQDEENGQMSLFDFGD